MNEQEQRNAIAEFCEWKMVRVGDDHNFELWELVSSNPPYNRIESYKLPDYLNDLNAIHEAVSKLSPLHKRIFGDVLNEILEVFDDDYYEGMKPSHEVSCFSEAITRISQATAKQKSEALLRTLGLWKD